jgi:peptidoglycan/xylan/chitin deacetylase (PgdA/CDA1 family)
MILPDLTTAARLKDLAAQGWELAMHTDTHVDLKDLATNFPFSARLEIRTCQDKILAATGVSATTLVLPFGDNVADLKILYREHVIWTVGIGGGEKYRTTNWTYYVGREGPDGDALSTFNILMARFNP